METTTYLLVSMIFLVAYLWFRTRHNPNLPPCPVMPVPLLGHLIYMDKNPRPQFKKWRKKCGNIFSLYFCQKLVIVLNGYDLIKEALVNNTDITSDRPYIFFDAAVGRSGLGLVFSSGEVWKEHRAITVNTFRLLGIGKNILVEKVTEIVATNNEILERLQGEPTDLDGILTTSVANIISSIIMGHRFDHGDKEFLRICELFRDNVFEADGSNLANYFTFWKYLPGDLFGAKRIKARSHEFLTSFVDPFIQKKGYEEFDENNLDNYIARYMYEMRKKQNNGEKTTMSEDNLRKVVYDLFAAGMETIVTTLKWSILYFLHHPDIQEKVYKEIEKKVGTERVPNMSDKNQLPYLMAFLFEVQRISSIVPLNVPHMCTKDLTLGGYTIARGTQIMASLDSILFDKNIWGEDADSFRPERFLDEKRKVKYAEEFVPFSLGKRSCAGEGMAKIEMYLFFSSMVQRFKFLPADPKSLPTMKAIFGLTAVPVPYKVRVVKRKAAE